MAYLHNSKLSPSFRVAARVATRVSRKTTLQQRVSQPPISQSLPRKSFRGDNIPATPITPQTFFHKPNGNTTIPYKAFPRLGSRIHCRPTATTTSTAKRKHIPTTELRWALEHIQCRRRRSSGTTRRNSATRARAHRPRTTRSRRARSRSSRRTLRRAKRRNQRSSSCFPIPSPCLFKI